MTRMNAKSIRDIVFERHDRTATVLPAAEAILEAFPWAHVRSEDLLFSSDGIGIRPCPFAHFEVSVGREREGVVWFRTASNCSANEHFDSSDPQEMLGAASSVVRHFLEKAEEARAPTFRTLLTWKKVTVEQAPGGPDSPVLIDARTIVIVSPTSRAWTTGFLMENPTWVFGDAGPILAAGIPKDDPALRSVSDFSRRALKFRDFKSLTDGLQRLGRRPLAVDL